MRSLILIAIASLSGLALPAQSPTLSATYPIGAQRGSEIGITAYGTRIGRTLGVFFYDVGIELLEVEPVAKRDDQVRLKLRVAADCRLGDHSIRLRTDRGVTNMRLFWIGALAEAYESGDNNSFERAQSIALGSTVNGSIREEDRDWFRVEAPAASRVHFEVQGVRLGVEAFDPYLAVYDSSGHMLTECDDSAFGRMDPLCSVTSETAATYFIELREASFGGGPASLYRLHVGTFPRPTGAVPSGGRPGETLELTMLGDGEPWCAKVSLPESGRFYDYFPHDERGVAPTPIRLALFNAPNVLAQVADAPVEFELPAALGGVLGEPGAVDRFCFRANEGDRISIRAVARTLRSPVDPVVTVSRGDSSSENDDSNGMPDSVLSFGAKADGEYVVAVHDHLMRGGPDFFYRLEVSRSRGDAPGVLSARTSLRRDAEWVAVPRGGRMMTIVTIANPVEGARIVLQDLPPGVTAQGGVIGPGATSAPVVLTAGAQAPLSGSQVALGVSYPGRSDVQSARYSDDVRLVRVRNDQTYLSKRESRLPVAVTNEAPFAVEIVPPSVPVVRGGPFKLHVDVQRAAGFKGEVRVKLAWLPPGVSASELTLGANATDGEMSLSASSTARVGEWEVAGYGHSNIRGGTLRVATNLVSLTVADPWLTAALGKVELERGSARDVEVKLAILKPFDGVARANFENLPRGITGQTREIAAGAQQLVISLDASLEAVAGKHSPLLNVAVPSDGGPILHYFRIGELRIDDPVPRHGAAATPEPSPARGSVARPKT